MKNKILLTVAGLAIVLTAVFLFVQSQAKTKFAHGTIVGSESVSGMTLEELKKEISDYSLTIVYQDETGKEATETIRGADFGIRLKEEQASAVLKKQSAWSYFGGGMRYSVKDWISYDVDKLTDVIDQLGCLDAERFTSPKNAYISEYDEESGYQIVKETRGNILDKEKARSRIAEAVDQMDSRVELFEEDCYQKAEITAQDAGLNKTLNQLNTYAGAKITYRFGKKKEVVDGTLISKWLKVNKKGKVKLQAEKVEEYVSELRKKYDTIFRSRRFKTSYGKTITITGGDYGWWMNYTEEQKQLTKLILAGKQTERTPEYYQTAQNYGKKDYGDTYVEINLTAQHVFLYKDGKKILETDCVTGNSSRGFDTPAGTYSITYTERNATLQGENYSTPVKYWMPFNRNIGLHDANWRSSFGGEIYKYNGSHGCVNLPPDKAAKIFKYVEKGTPVFCYKLAVPKKVTKKPAATSVQNTSKTTDAQNTNAADSKKPASSKQKNHKANSVKKAQKKKAKSNAKKKTQESAAKNSAKKKAQQSVAKSSTKKSEAKNAAKKKAKADTAKKSGGIKKKGIKNDED